MDNFNFAQQGWQCPICKRVYSPFTPMCYCCGAEGTTNTSTDRVIHQKEPPRFTEEPSSFTSVFTGYDTYTAEDIRTCDNCKHNAGLPSHNGTKEYSGACKKCVAKDMWERKYE